MEVGQIWTVSILKFEVQVKSVGSGVEVARGRPGSGRSGEVRGGVPICAYSECHLRFLMRYVDLDFGGASAAGVRGACVRVAVSGFCFMYVAVPADASICLSLTAHSLCIWWSSVRPKWSGGFAHGSLAFVLFFTQLPLTLRYPLGHPPPGNVGMSCGGQNLTRVWGCTSGVRGPH